MAASRCALVTRSRRRPASSSASFLKATSSGWIRAEVVKAILSCSAPDNAQDREKTAKFRAIGGVAARIWPASSGGRDQLAR